MTQEQQQQKQPCNDDNNNIKSQTTTSPPHSAFHRSVSGVVASGAKHHNSCRRHQRRSTAEQRNRRRQQCNNATQTPTTVDLPTAISWPRYSHCCGFHNAQTAVAHNCGTNNCCQLMQSEECISSKRGVTKADIMCHCHITHHCHQHYSPSDGIVGGSGDGNRSRMERRRHHRRRRTELCRPQQQPQWLHQHQQLYLPATTTKSSLSSDEQLDDEYERQQHQQRQRRASRSSRQQQQIAIEIDAATTTLTEDNRSECNNSTGTSNFSYRLTNDRRRELQQDELHDGRTQQCCRNSFISDRTVETSEQTATDESCTEANALKQLERRRKYVTESAAADVDGSDVGERRTDVICFEDSQCCRSANDAPHNACVKIQRKRFMSSQQEYSNSSSSCCCCSRCSSCSCQLGLCNSSCSCSSSVDDIIAAPHEFTVAADCHHHHRCPLQRQSTNSTAGGAADDEADDTAGAGNTFAVANNNKNASNVNAAAALTGGQSVQRETENDSARTSRRSSRDSFCTCNSNSCCYCSCSCDECGDAVAAASSEIAVASSTTLHDAEQHSSTLTPITQPSTPLAEGTPTLCSNSSYTVDEDSNTTATQSAEYFSLSSNQQSLQQQLATDATAAAALRKQCKHYSKHHRHKYDATPLNSSL